MEQANRQLVKALPRYGVRERELQCPTWIETECRKRENKRWWAEVCKRKRRAALMEKAKIAVAGAAFVVMALATAVVR